MRVLQDMLAVSAGQVPPNQETLKAIYAAQKTAYQARKPGYSFQQEVPVLNNVALDKTNPKHLEKLIAALLAGEDAYLACSYGPYKLSVTGANFDTLKKLRGECFGTWDIWACLGKTFARFTDARCPGAWLCGLDMEPV